MGKMMCKCAMIGRVLIGIALLAFGILKIVGFSGAVGYAASAGLPLPEVIAVVAIIIEIVGGLAIIAGRYTRYAVPVVAVYLVVTTLVFHYNLADAMQQGQFLKNLAIIGGVLVLCSCSASKGCCDDSCKDGGCGCSGGVCEPKGMMGPKM